MCSAVLNLSNINFLQDLQRSRRIIQSRLQGAPPHAAPAWPAVGIAADDLLLGHDFDADLPASPLGRKRRWAAAAAGGWPGQEAAQQLPPWEAPAALGRGSRPALSLAGAWGGAAAGQAWRQQQGGGAMLQDPDQDIQLDLSGEGLLSMWGSGLGHQPLLAH